MKQSEFPYIKDFKDRFPITENTAFVYNGKIYHNIELPDDILIHEEAHIKRQNKIGADLWIKRYLTDDKFRLEEEVYAYKVQINSIKDRNDRNLCRLECVKNLSSTLYGNLVSSLEAFKLLSK